MTTTPSVQTNAAASRLMTKADPNLVDGLLTVHDKDACMVVGPGFCVTGAVVCEDSDKLLVVAGKVQGSIRSAGWVAVLEGGVVEGSIRAPRVTIAGRVARATDTDGVAVDGELALAATAKLECDAVYEQLHAERGSVLAGLMIPFNSSYFHELHGSGRLGFLDQLPPAGRLSRVPVEESESSAGAGAGDSSSAPTEARRDSTATAPASIQTERPTGEAIPLRSLAVAETPESLSQDGQPGVFRFPSVGAGR